MNARAHTSMHDVHIHKYVIQNALLALIFRVLSWLECHTRCRSHCCCFGCSEHVRVFICSEYLAAYYICSVCMPEENNMHVKRNPFTAWQYAMHITQHHIIFPHFWRQMWSIDVFSASRNIVIWLFEHFHRFIFGRYSLHSIWIREIKIQSNCVL